MGLVCLHIGRLCFRPSEFIFQPPFSLLEGREMGQKQRRPKARRWSAEYLVLAAMLMMWEADTALRDSFMKARECVVEMFPKRRRCGKTYQVL